MTDEILKDLGLALLYILFVSAVLYLLDEYGHKKWQALVIIVSVFGFLALFGFAMWPGTKEEFELFGHAVLVPSWALLPLAVIMPFSWILLFIPLGLIVYLVTLIRDRKK